MAPQDYRLSRVSVADASFIISERCCQILGTSIHEPRIALHSDATALSAKTELPTSTDLTPPTLKILTYRSTGCTNFTDRGLDHSWGGNYPKMLAPAVRSEVSRPLTASQVALRFELKVGVSWRLWPLPRCRKIKSLASIEERRARAEPREKVY